MSGQNDRLSSDKVTDGEGLSNAKSIQISPGNTPPAVVIDNPLPTVTWRVGQSIAFSGHATDEEQGTLGAAALTWSLVINHCSTQTNCHQHPVQEFQGVSSATFVAPDHEYPSYLTLSLTAIDAGDLRSVATRRLDPQTVTVALQSAPAGLTLGLRCGDPHHARRRPDADRRFEDHAERTVTADACGNGLRVRLVVRRRRPDPRRHRRNRCDISGDVPSGYRWR